MTFVNNRNYMLQIVGVAVALLFTVFLNRTDIPSTKLQDLLGAKKVETNMMKMASKMFMGSGSARLLRKVAMIEPGDDRLPVYTLTFATPDGKDSLGVRADMGDVVKVVVPGYKPKSYSVSDSRPGEFDLTVKIYPNGRASGYLDRIPIGGEIEVFRKGNKRRQAGRCVVIIAFGVGITEGLPIAEAELEKGDAEHVHLLWASRTLADTFWHDRIAVSKERFGKKFQLSLLLSRERHPDHYYGRLTGESLQSTLREHWAEITDLQPSDVRFLTVGTKEMMREAEAVVQSLGYELPSQLLLIH